MSEFERIRQLEKDNILGTYNRFEIGLDHGQGAMLYDFDGNAYLDLTSGIGVNSLGHNHPVLKEALCDQISRLMASSNLFYTKPSAEAAAILTKESGMDKVFFANSGAEANEGAIKCARKYAAEKHGKDCYKILTLKNSFHGRTIATLEATGQDAFHKDFFPYTDGFDYIEPNNIEDLKAKADDKTAAVMVELIQGESGVRPLDKEYVKELESFCKEHDILLIVDEVQTGIGRTGKLFCYQNYDIQPDLVTMAKGLGGGIPIGGFLTNEKTSGVLKAGDHGSTFGGNPIAGRAAQTVLGIVTQPEFLDEVEQKGQLLRDLLGQIESEDIQDIRGIGLMNGVQVPAEKLADYVQKCMAKGLLVLKAGNNTIRLLPPLIISEDEIRQAAAIMKEVFEG